MYYFYLILFISFFLMFLSFFISKKDKNNREKMSSFECGFNLFLSPRNPFSLRFFLISIIFLIFDIEIILLLPFILNILNINLYFLFTLFFIFILILIWGLFHEWFLGSINWM